MVAGELRRYIEALDRRGTLARISRRVSWKYEIGGITRRAKVPLLFENIDEYPGKAVFTNGLSSRASIALCLGMEPAETTWRQLVREIRRRNKPLAPELTGAYGEMEQQWGKEVDLSVLPIPWWHEADAGRYAGTWHVNVTRDPVTQIGNAGVYRMLMLNKRHTTLSVSPKSHLACHMREAERRKEPLPMAVAIGIAEPAVLAAAAAVARDQDELGFAGALMGRPLQVRRCELSELLIPADAEVIMEGVVIPGARVIDGPYMDYAGTPNVNPRAFVYQVRRLSWRRDLVYRGTAVGIPGGEDHLLFAMLAAAGLADFHGSAARRAVQNFFLRFRLFRLFQTAGRLGQRLRKL